MRRIGAVVAATLLIVLFAGTALATGPTRLVNSFVGNFDMVDSNGHVVGHVVASFKEPSNGRLVPGSVDVTWADYDPANPPFRFMDFQGASVRESHAQLISAWFNQDLGTEWAGDATNAGVSGYLCEYAGPWNAECRPFYVIFSTRTVGPSRGVVWGIGTQDASDPNAPQVELFVGPGAFALNYAGPTGS